MPALSDVIARNIAALRAARGWTQQDLAAEMAGTGMAWSGNRVAQVETLRSPVSVVELMALCWVFETDLARFFEGEEKITMAVEGYEVDLSVFREITRGHAGKLRQERLVQDEGNRLRSERRAEEMRKLDGRLGLEWWELDSLAYVSFGHDFISERERRVGDLHELSKRSAQTKRGHATRTILTELGSLIAVRGLAAVKRDIAAEIAAARERDNLLMPGNPPLSADVPSGSPKSI